MRIIDSFVLNGRVYALCVGSEVRYGMDVQKLTVGGIDYDIKESFAKESLTGIMQLELLVDSSEPLPIGEEAIISQINKAAS